MPGRSGSRTRSSLRTTATYDTEANHSKAIADDVARILRGDKPVNCVNPEVLT